MRRGGWRRSRRRGRNCATVFVCFFSVGEGMGEGEDEPGAGARRVGALSVAREGRVPLVLVLLAVFALAYVDVAA